LQLPQEPHHIGPHELTITPSIGVAIFPADGKNLKLLNQCADAAMYSAKHGGRNNFRFYTAEIQAKSARVLLLENALRRAGTGLGLAGRIHPNCRKQPVDHLHR